MIADVIPPMRFEFQPSIRYYLAATAVLAASLAIIMQPEVSEPLPVTTLDDPQQDSQNPISARRPPASLNQLGSFPFRLAVFLIGVSTTAHVIASFLNLQGLPRLAFGILAPVACAVLWHLLGTDRRHTSVEGVLLLTLPLCAFGFVFVSCVFNLLFQPQTRL